MDVSKVLVTRRGKEAGVGADRQEGSISGSSVYMRYLGPAFSTVCFLSFLSWWEEGTVRKGDGVRRKVGY